MFDQNLLETNLHLGPASLNLLRRLVLLLNRLAPGSPTPEERAAVADALEALAAQPGNLPEQHLVLTARAVRQDRWDGLVRPFVSEDFLSPDGTFLLLQPQRATRLGQSTVRWSLVAGKRLPGVDLPRGWEDAARSALGEALPTLRMWPVELYAAAGHSDGAAGAEAFFVANSWEVPGMEAGPALNAMNVQHARLAAGTAAIDRLFEPVSAQLFKSVHPPGPCYYQLNHLEYWAHSLAHGTGWGIDSKLDSLRANVPFGAVEEHRADAVAMELFVRTLPAAEAGRLIASNLLLRFALDAHREGTLERDLDAGCAFLTLTRLLDGGALVYTPDQQLALTDPRLEALVPATAAMRARALDLTRAERALRWVKGVELLFAGEWPRFDHPAYRVWRDLVEPAGRGVFSALR